MDKSFFEYKRKWYISIGEIFFWTATINQWKHLLKAYAYKALADVKTSGVRNSNLG